MAPGEPMPELVIEFNQSKSSRFKAAAKIASSLAGYSVSNGRHIVSAGKPADFIQVEKLWAIVGNWKGSRLLVNGASASPAVFMPVKCYGQYCSAIIQSIHCKRTKEYSGWSCKHLIVIERHSCLSSYPWDDKFWWYQVGRFISKDVWEIDKEQIAEILKKESAKKCLSLCPNFSWRKVQIHIDNLPARIDLKDNDLWEIAWLREPGFELRAVGVKPKQETIESFTGHDND
jgi:hypothetical protein